MKKRTIFPILFLFYFIQNITAQTVSLAKYSEGYNWLIGFETAPGDDRLYAFQKDGFVKICNTNGTIVSTPFLDISTKVNNSFNNEQGLVGLAFHPDYQANGYCFAFYNEIGTGDAKVVRFERSTTNPDQLDPSTETLIISWPHPKPNHVGGCLKFGLDGYLYIASGDGGGAGDPDGNGQNGMTFLGKLLRIDVDNGMPYSIPPTNPFAAALSIFNEIWAYGLRNPWRFSFDKKTGDLWIADVGQDEREEINFQKYGTPGGQNYGWSCKEGTLDFNTDQCFPGNIYTDPIYEYAHSLASGECSISGGVVYRGTEYADLYGKYIFTDFCSGRVWALNKINDTVESVVEMGNFDNNDFTILDQNEKGELFITGFFSNKIYKLKSNDCSPVAIIEGPSSITLQSGETAELVLFANENYNYQWFLNGNIIPGANAATLTVSEVGSYSVQVENQGCTNISNIVTVVNGNNQIEINGKIIICENSVQTYNTNFIQNASYQWFATGGSIVSNNNTGEITIEWGGAISGQINVQVTIPGGEILEGNLSVEVVGNDIGLTAAVTPLSCPNTVDGAIDLHVIGSGPFDYQWSNGSTSEDISNLAPGAYSVIVSNSIGCETTAQFVVTAPLSPNFPPIIFPVFCDTPFVLPEIFIDSMLFCGATWIPINTDSLGNGTYNLVLTDCNGCEYSNTISISNPPPISIQFAVTEPTPGFADGEITVDVAGGITPYTFLWDNGEMTQTISNLLPGIYTVSVADANGCVSTGSVNIGEPLSSLFLEGISEFKALPNPFRDHFELELKLNNTAEITFIVSDAMGREVEIITDKKTFTNGEHQWMVDTSNWPKGVYFLIVQIKGEKTFWEMVKQ